MWYICSGRNGENWVSTSVAKSRRDALKEAYLSVKLGHDWVEVYQHDEGSFWMF